MPIDSVMKYCKNCEKQTPHVVQKPNHVLHLFLTVFTGFWLIIWIFMTVSSRPQCTECGNKKSKAIQGLIALIISGFLLGLNFVYLFLDEIGFEGWPFFALANFVGTNILGALLGRMWPLANLVVMVPVIGGVGLVLNSFFTGAYIDERLYVFVYTILLPGGSSLSGSFLGYYTNKIIS